MCSIVDDVIDNRKCKAIRLIILIRGIKSESKKKVLNAAMVIYVRLCRLKRFDAGDMNPHAFYQPNMMAKMLKHIFKCLNDASVQFSQSDFYGMAGGYHALLDEYYDKVSKGMFSITKSPAGDQCSNLILFYYLSNKQCVLILERDLCRHQQNAMTN